MKPIEKILLIPQSFKHQEIAAASSLINVNNRIFLCNDDQYSLFELVENLRWIEHRWKDAPLMPLDHTARKKVKPDYEALTKIDVDSNKILMIPSGSKENRVKVLAFDLVNNQFNPFEVLNLYADLKGKISSVNIEGAEFFRNHILLLNRGVSDQQSSLIKVNPKSFKIESNVSIEFGSIDGVPLHGSELCLFNDNLYVLAIAEDTPNSYDDGVVLGSSLFKLSVDSFEILEQWNFDKATKLEGLCRWNNTWLVASDPDGMGPSQFYSFSL